MFKKILLWIYKDLYKDHDNIISELHEDIKEMTDMLNNRIKVIEELKEKINPRKKYEDFLNSKYKQRKLIYTKRWAIKDKKLIPLNICDFIAPRLTLVNKKSTLQSIWKENIKYVYDHFAYKGALDVWQLPEETMVLKAGDCDDSGSYRIAKAKSNGLGNNLFAALGFYKTTGHYFAVSINQDKLYILEPTTNKWSMISHEGSDYKICYLFNENYCWEVDGRYKFGALSKDFNIKKLRR